MMHLNDRYQAFCRSCHKTFEADTHTEVIDRVKEHESKVHNLDGNKNNIDWYTLRYGRKGLTINGS